MAVKAESVVVLPLSQGLFAIIGEEDAHLAEHTWSACLRGGTWYAFRNVETHEGRTTVYLHIEIMGESPSPGLLVDHRNGRGLDCRRVNLRWATRSQNARNRRRTEAGYMGVRRRQSGRWEAYGIDPSGRQVGLGTYDTPEEANVARLVWERNTFGVAPQRVPDYEEAGLV